MEENKDLYLKTKLQKCYVWLNDKNATEPLAIINGCYFPIINEQLIIWDSQEQFKRYKCVNRIFGINKDSNTIVLNIYVEKIIEENDDKNE